MSHRVESRGALGVLPAALALVLAFEAGRVDPRSAAPAADANPVSEDTCLRLRVEPRGVPELVADAVAILRRSGHDPSSYALELRAGGGGGEPSLVFRPRGDGRLYAVAVRPADPCLLSWVWQPERFTEWQVAVLQRARELLRGSASAPGAEPTEVAIVETSETVTVRVRYAQAAEPGSGGSESQVTLLKADIGGAGN